MRRLLSAFFSLLRRILTAVVTLLVIAYLTLFGLIMAQRGTRGLPANVLGAAGEAFRELFSYVTAHPQMYTWHKVDYPAMELVQTIFLRSAALLGLSLVVAAAIGIPLGISAALARRKRGAPLVLFFSILGVSTPSFLLGMFLWVGNIYLYRLVGRPVLPQTGFGFDQHMIMPTLVLATRPLAQIAQVTYVSFSEVMGEDYIRTARSKGLAEEIIRNRHALRNVLIPILTTVGTSLRFSLASLPVVETFFYWPGVGRTLLEAIQTGVPSLVTDLILSLGLLFLVVNLFVELLYPLLDPRLRDQQREARQRKLTTWQERLADARDLGIDLWEGARQWAHRVLLPFQRIGDRLLRGRRDSASPARQTVRTPRALPENTPLDFRRSRWILRSIVRNPALILGVLLVVALCAVGIWGERWAPSNPYVTRGVEFVDGVISTPPFEPSADFPWGSDFLGRDVQSLVLAGAKRTLALALFGMVARVLLGTALGLLAGWWQGGWFDRLVNGAIGVWAAFPVTIFAMILIYALGIQQGMWVFIFAICVVGWGEVAQFVRGQVVTLRPQLFIEGARAVGTPPRQILVRHILPHLVVPLVVLGVLEIGGILMLLAELGFLGVFLGGGFRVDVSGAFSDVPEWGAQLASILRWWRSYPWMAWAPGLAFFLAILAFNIWGEGLRRFVVDSRINLNRLVNKYTVGVAAVLLIGFLWVLQSTAPLGVYRSQAELFDAQRALEHVRVLSSPEYAGRLSGTPQAKAAADYIAAQMKEMGLQTAGRGGTFVVSEPAVLANVDRVPRLEVLDAQGGVLRSLVYRQDFVELASGLRTYGDATGPVVGVVAVPFNDPEGKQYALSSLGLYDKVIVLWDEDLSVIGVGALTAAGVLVVTEDPMPFERRLLYQSSIGEGGVPTMYITPAAAEQLLETAGTSLEGLRQLRVGLGEGEVAVTSPGAALHVQILLASSAERDDNLYAVMGMIAGSGSDTGSRPGEGMDSQIILVAAYYDGLGIGPEGTFYPGANDNASGVAVLLEVARALRDGPFEPYKTVVFVVWSGGERGGVLRADRMMNATRGLNLLTIEAVVELSGVGAGSGHQIALLPGSSFRMVQLFQSAASRMGVGTTTRGRGLHFDLPLGGQEERDAITVYLSWDGADATAHTPQDTFETIDVEKLKKVGQTTVLGVTVLARELDY
jgi:peptide/nickel transport system permease protein